MPRRSACGEFPGGEKGGLAAKSLSGGPFGQRHSRRNGADRLDFARPPEGGAFIPKVKWRRGGGRQQTFSP
jgi:hypothetical protein